MRIPIVQEGVMLPGNRYIAPGAVKFDQKPIPLTLGSSSGPIVGKAGDFQREDDGKITAEVTLTDDARWLKAQRDFELVGYFNKLDACNSGCGIVFSCQLVASHVILTFSNNIPII